MSGWVVRKVVDHFAWRWGGVYGVGDLQSADLFFGGGGGGGLDTRLPPTTLKIVVHIQDYHPERRPNKGSFSPQNGPQHGTTVWETPY